MMLFVVPPGLTLGPGGTLTDGSRAAAAMMHRMITPAALPTRTIRALARLRPPTRMLPCRSKSGDSSGTMPGLAMAVREPGKCDPTLWPRAAPASAAAVTRPPIAPRTGALRRDRDSGTIPSLEKRGGRGRLLFLDGSCADGAGRLRDWSLVPGMKVVGAGFGGGRRSERGGGHRRGRHRRGGGLVAMGADDAGYVRHRLPVLLSRVVGHDRLGEWHERRARLVFGLVVMGANEPRDVAAGRSDIGRGGDRDTGLCGRGSGPGSGAGVCPTCRRDRGGSGEGGAECAHGSGGGRGRRAVGPGLAGGSGGGGGRSGICRLSRSGRHGCISSLGHLSEQPPVFGSRHAGRPALQLDAVRVRLVRGPGCGLVGRSALVGRFGNRLDGTVGTPPPGSLPSCHVDEPRFIAAPPSLRTTGNGAMG